MPRRTQTYAIRLAVEGGGQVKAELVSVGQSGEQSLKRIETAGGRASGGLKGLGRQAELLLTGIRTLGGALIGAATVGGLGALIDRSISAADAIGKTADKIGVGVEALQELRFAAKASGVEQQTLDMALQRFTRRAAEAAQGTGEAKDALAQIGIALRDQSGNLRRSEDLLGDVADAFARIEDPAERVRLAFKLFDSEGVALVNLLRDGSGAVEEMRDRARDLGIVLDEHLVRDAERARTELDTLSQVISANLTRAALEAAPVIADLSSWLADVAGKAGIAWERLFDAPEEKSLRTLRYELDLASSTIEKLEARIRELQESPTLGFTTFIDTAQISALERKLDELRRARDQTQARIAFLEGPPDTGAPTARSAPAPDDTGGVQDQAKNLERIARELEGTLFNITHEGSARIIAEHERRIAEIEALRAKDGSNAAQVDRLTDDPIVWQTSHVIGAPTPVSQQTGIPFETPSQGFYLNLPALSAEDGQTGAFWLGAAPAWSLPNTRWRGAVIYRSGDGVTFTDYTAVTTGVAWAKARTVLPAHERWGVWDEDNVLDLLVQSPGLEFESRTDLEVLDGANLLLVGQEIIHFAEAEQVGALEWRLSRLLGGRRGTEWAMSTHQVGEAVLVLDPATLVRVSTLDQVGLSRFYRAVSIGSDPSLPEAVAFTNQAASLKPYAPAHIRGSRNGAGDLTITWIRRTRYSGEWRDLVDVPLNEASEAYEVNVLDGAGQVVRTLGTLGRSADYTAADQSTDFGAAQSTVEIAVYQLSAAVGRGFGGRATL